eukprot:144705-Prymnesium_polylepis.1
MGYEDATHKPRSRVPHACHVRVPRPYERALYGFMLPESRHGPRPARQIGEGTRHIRRPRPARHIRGGYTP